MPSINIPNELQDPVTDFKADFKLSVNMESIFIFDILMHCSIEILAIFCLSGVPEPFCSPNSFLISSVVGGVPISILYSFVFVSTASFTGTCIPSSEAVFLLTSWRTCCIFIFRGPNF